MFPAFPSGATVPSILLACVQTGRLSSIRQKVGGLPFKQPRDVMGYQNDPEVLAQHVFAGELTLHDLLLHHTVAPIYLSLIDRRFVSDVADVTSLSLSEWRRRKSDCLLSAYALRLCPQCVEEDTAKFGCGHWRREHQIRFVRICTKHLTALHEQCATPNCGARLSMRSQILPGQPCPTCHGTETSGLPIGPISAGYLAYCKLFTDALHMRIPELDPDNQLDLCSLHHDFCNGDVYAFSRILANWLCDQWCDSYYEWDVATDFLRSPYKTRFGRFIAPSLILLAAFKRDMFGAPLDSEASRWSASPDLLQMS